MPPNQEPAVVQNQDLAVLHAIGAHPLPHAHYQTPQIPAHIAPAIITADNGLGLMHNLGSSLPAEGVAMGRYHGSMVTPHLVSVAPPPAQNNLMGVSLDYSVTSTDSLQGHVRMLPREQAGNVRQHSGASSSHFPRYDAPLPSNSRTVMLGESRVLLNDGAGPSRNIDSDSGSDSDSMDSNSPSRNFASLIYGVHRYSNYDNDSDDSSETPIELDSSDARELSDLSADSQMSSDVDESSSPSSVSDTSSPTNPSTIRHISSSTATVVISPVPSPAHYSAAASDTINLTLNTTFDSSEGGSPETATTTDEPGPLTLPVLINIADSDSSHVTRHPTAVIDLTAATSSPSGVSESNLPLSSFMSSVTSQDQQLASSSYAEALPSFVPVIQQTLEGAMYIPQQTAGSESGIQLETTRLYGGSIPEGQEVRLATRHCGHPMSVPRRAQLSEREGAVIDGQDIQLVNHSVVQMTQPLPHGPAPQIYASHGQLAQQQPLHSYTHHAHDPAFPSYSTHVPSGSGSMEMPPVVAPIVPMESNTAAVAMGSSVRVLRWQPTLSGGTVLTV